MLYRRWRFRRQERAGARSGKRERRIIGSAGGAPDGRSVPTPAAERANAASSAAPVAHQTAGAYPHPQRKGRTPHHRQRLFRGRNVEGARLRPRGKRIEVTPRCERPQCERPQLNDRTLRSQFSSSQFLVPGSWFLVPGSWFLVPGSRFLVLSSPHPATRAAIPPYPSVPVAHRHRHSLLRPRT
jgi:hypothetical protein